MWLPWDYALILASGLAVIAFVARRARTKWVVGAGAFAAEAALVAVLYAAWQYAGRLSVTKTDGAVDRALWLWDLERAMWLPDEVKTQAMILGHDWLVQASNIYYGGAHVPGMGIFLVWLFARHRDVYPQWRNAIAMLTAASLAVQLIPLAPPRLVGELGIVDTGIVYGQSVYATMGSTVAGQLQAMPSLHVGWAVLIGVAAWQVSTSPWRWIGMGHAALTSWVVVVTGNHFWLDGVVVVVLLAVIMAGQSAARRLRARWRSDRRDDLSEDDGPEDPWPDAGWELDVEPALEPGELVPVGVGG